MTLTTEADMVRNDTGKWVTLLVECRVCTKRHVSVNPPGGRLSDQECPNCGNMTCDPADEPKPWEHDDE